MVKIRKNREYETTTPNTFVVVRAVPEKGDKQKNFYIADVIVRSPDEYPGDKALSMETKTFTAPELKELLGIEKNDRIFCY